MLRPADMHEPVSAGNIPQVHGDVEPERHRRVMLAAEADRLGQLLAQRFHTYRCDPWRSLFQLLTTTIPFAALLALMAVASRGNYWLTLVLAVPTAGLLVRLFIIQHDCGHGSFFRSRLANDLLGRALCVLTLTPYGNWRLGHAAHHASTGNLERRGRGDVDTLTVAEYRALTPARRLAYRLYRNPFIMVLIGAPINFIVLQRLPTGRARHDPAARRSIISLNIAIAIAFGAPMALFGAGTVLAIYLPVMIIAAWVGNWLFYVQHQFEDTYWERDDAWSFRPAALLSSSYLKLPRLLQWFSGNIGLHHIHHLSTRVPNYHLQACLDAAPELQHFAKVMTFRQSMRCWRLALWDEQRHRLVRFRDERLHRLLAERTPVAAASS